LEVAHALTKLDITAAELSNIMANENQRFEWDTPTIGCIIKYDTRILSRTRWGVVRGVERGYPDNYVVQNVKLKIVRRDPHSSLTSLQWVVPKRSIRHSVNRYDNLMLWCSLEEVRNVVARRTPTHVESE